VDMSFIAGRWVVPNTANPAAASLAWLAPPLGSQRQIFSYRLCSILPIDSTVAFSHPSNDKLPGKKLPIGGR
jgi:hypothetical protein